MAKLTYLRQFHQNQPDPSGENRPRFHKACRFNVGRWLPRDREQVARWRKSVERRHRLGSLTDAEAAVLLTLPTWLNRKSGRCDPAHGTIAKKAGVCVKTVQRALEGARRLRLVDWDQRAVKIGSVVTQISNLYRLFPGIPAPKEAPAIDASPQEQRSTVLRRSEDGCSDSISIDESLSPILRAALARLGNTGGFNKGKIDG